MVVHLCVNALSGKFFLSCEGQDNLLIVQWCVLFHCTSESPAECLFSKNSSLIMLTMQNMLLQQQWDWNDCHNNDGNGLNQVKNKKGKCTVWNANSTMVATILMISLMQSHRDAIEHLLTQR